jgi:nucleotide-binding universal stress UspA family protein
MMATPAQEGMRMVDDTTSKTGYLALDKVAANPRLARRLPAELAQRFHALPLAEDNGRITVAMANPHDGEARDAVMTALGPASCVVQADPGTIDTLLSQIWGHNVACQPELLVCSFPNPVADEVQTYAQSLAVLLGARVCQLTTAERPEALVLGRAEQDLFVFGRGDHPLIPRLLSQQAQPSSQSRPGGVPLSVLIAQEPRWPLQHLLLVVQGRDGDDAALDWALRLGRAASSTVTVLAVVPPAPAMYDQRERLGYSLPALLSSDSLLGRQLRRICRRLVDWEVEGALRLRQGVPEHQIRREVIEGDYDLVVVAAGRQARWRRCLEGDLIGSLLRWAGRPLLVARPATT